MNPVTIGSTRHQPPAEAQAQGGGEDNQCDGCCAGYGERNGIHVLPDGTPYMACQAGRYAPPSAPVGVDKPLPVFSAGTWTYSETGQAFSAADLDEAAFVAYRDHLAPQPAPAAVAGGDAEEDAYVIDALAHLLAEISVIVNGPEPAGTKWSYHDLPAKVAAMKGGAQ